MECEERRLISISYVLQHGRNSMDKNDTLPQTSKYQLQVTVLIKYIKA